MKKWLFILFFSFCCTLVHGQDRDALMALYDATDGPNWLRNDNWGSAMPLDTWYGVTTNATGRVIDLNLYDYVDPIIGNTGGSNNLTGTLPDELGDLTALESFGIGLNPNLTGPIPNTIGNLINLQILFLFGNSLSGQIPDSLGNLINLRDMRMGGNQFSGEIPATFIDLINIERIALSDNQLSGTIPPFLENLINLNHLGLGLNQLTGTIPSELGNILGLRFLDLSRNQLTGTIPDSLGNLTLMGNFQVSDNQLTGTLPVSLNQWTIVSILDFSNNMFEGDIPSFTFSGALGTPSLYIDENRFQFGDFEDEFTFYSGPDLVEFIDNPQAPINDFQNLTPCAGSDVTLTTTASGSANVYEWFRNGVALPASNTPELTVTNIQEADAGEYTCQVSSTIVTDLILLRNPITITIDATGPIANPIKDLFTCAANGDGFGDFTIDISDIEAQVLGNQTGLTVSYFDAMGNPLTLTDSFKNTTANQQDITVRVESSPSCYDETILSLMVNEGVTADVLPNQSECAYTLPVLSQNNTYYSESNQGGIQLNTGDVISATQTIYIYTETGSGDSFCSAKVVLWLPLTPQIVRASRSRAFLNFSPLMVMV